jgi:SAM-dependent methyltransferase
MRRVCWCGNNDLKPFSPDYRHCRACGTLVSQVETADDGYLVNNDEDDFYGKQYWLGHQAEELGLPQIEERSRLDVPERCVHWLRHLLRFRLPPARVLELGSAHGGFVALLRAAGFDATGLEMSPWVAELARRTFRVPMLVGPVENQDLVPGSFDVVVANDVMEHLPDPLTTLGQAVRLLRPDGVLVIQMPEYPDGKSFAELQAAQDRFLLHLRKDEHLFLYSRRAACQAFRRLGLEHFEFQPPMFDYDQYVFASRIALAAHPPKEGVACLKSTAEGRLLLALLDKDDELKTMTRHFEAAETDRAARLAIIDDLGKRLAASDEDRARRLQLINDLGRQVQDLGRQVQAAQSHVQTLQQEMQGLGRQLAVSEADRAARLKVIHEQQQQLAVVEADRAARLRALNDLSRNLMVSEEDRHARLRVIQSQERLLHEQQSTIAAQQKALAFLHASCLGSPPPSVWSRLATRLARLILPWRWRHGLRQRLGRVRPQPRQAVGAGPPR